MLNIKTVREIYLEQHINSEEEMYVDMIFKYRSWLNKSDEEKLLDRIQSHKISVKLGVDEVEEEYENQANIFLRKLISFLKEADGDNKFINYSSLSENGNKMFRIYSLLYCEKELLFYSSSLRGTKIHVPFEIFKPLAEEMENSNEFDKYELASLFEEYRKLLKLFSLNPYKE